MAGDTSAGVRITIWRPYTPDRPLAIQSSETDSVRVVGPDLPLQQEAFTWQVREDIWGGLVDSDLRQALSQRFISEFEPVLSPNQRSVEKLRALVEEIETALPKSEWSESGQQLEDDGETPYRLNPLLGFFTQMSWLCEVFKDTPGASVSVR
jgi:hypothetical protein